MDMDNVAAKLFPGCISLGSKDNVMIMQVNSWEEALRLSNHHLPYLAWLAQVCGKKALEIIHSTPGKPPRIPIAAAMAEQPPGGAIADYRLCIEEISNLPQYSENTQLGKEDSMTQSTIDNPETVLRNLQNVNSRRLLEFELEMQDSGLIASFTSQRTNICIKSGDLAYDVPHRSVWQPYRYRNFNYLIAWDVDFSGKPSDEFVTMQDLLRRDGFVPDFEYNLRRPGDNALVRYQSSFFLFPDPSGEPGGIRACISRQEDFEVIEPGDWAIAGR